MLTTTSNSNEIHASLFDMDGSFIQRVNTWNLQADAEHFAPIISFLKTLLSNSATGIIASGSLRSYSLHTEALNCWKERTPPSTMYLRRFMQVYAESTGDYNSLQYDTFTPGDLHGLPQIGRTTAFIETLISQSGFLLDRIHAEAEGNYCLNSAFVTSKLNQAGIPQNQHRLYLDTFFQDGSKFSLCYIWAHYLANKYPDKNINLHFYDDRAEILAFLEHVFKYNPSLLPSNVCLRLHVYISPISNSTKGGYFNPNIAVIQGQGESNPHWMQLLNESFLGHHSKITDAFNKFKEINKSFISVDNFINHLSQISTYLRITKIIANCLPHFSSLPSSKQLATLLLILEDLQTITIDINAFSVPAKIQSLKQLVHAITSIPLTQIDEISSWHHLTSDGGKILDVLQLFPQLQADVFKELLQHWLADDTEHLHYTEYFEIITKKLFVNNSEYQQAVQKAIDNIGKIFSDPQNLISNSKNLSSTSHTLFIASEYYKLTVFHYYCPKKLPSNLHADIISMVNASHLHANLIHTIYHIKYCIKDIAATCMDIALKWAAIIYDLQKLLLTLKKNSITMNLFFQLQLIIKKSQEPIKNLSTHDKELQQLLQGLLECFPDPSTIANVQTEESNNSPSDTSSFWSSSEEGFAPLLKTQSSNNLNENEYEKNIPTRRPSCNF